MNSELLSLPSPLVWTILFLLATRGTSLRTDPSEIPKGSMLYGKCRLLFNEINLFPNSQMQFIELKKICERSPNKAFAVTAIDKYKLLFIGNDGFLTVVCKLHGTGFRKNDDFYFVMGGSRVPERNMDMSKCHFAEDSLESKEKRLPTGNIFPVGILLIYNQKVAVLEKVDLKNNGTLENPRFLKVKITSGGTIMANLQDMIIATSYSPYTKCKYFDLFYNGFTPGEKTVIRDYGQIVTNDVALSRCPNEEKGVKQFHPFQMSTFGYAKRTPGEENDCRNAAFFYIEDTQPLRKKPKIDFTTTPGHECEITTEDPLIDSLNIISSPITYATMLQNALKEASSCPGEADNSPTPQPSEDLSHTENPDDSESDEDNYIVDGTFEFSIKPSRTFEDEIADAKLHNWQDCDKFEPKDLIVKLKRPEKQLLDWEDIMSPETCNWFEFLGWVKHQPRGKSPRFRCKICHALYSQRILMDRPGSKWITKIIKTGQGVRGKCAKADNRKLIRKHLGNPLHKIALMYIRLLDEGLRGDELMEALKQKGGEYQSFLEATENLFSATFQAVRLDINFFKFNILRELLEYYGIKIGHLYANPGGMKLITMSISDTLHQNYIEYLKKNRPEFSLLVDLSTDIAALPAAAFVFQTLDSKRKLEMSLYKVLHLSGETADEIYEAFMRQIRIDGLEEYLVEKMVGFASDSGSNVLKFRQKVQSIVDHQLIKTSCHAHRLENAHKAAWKTEPYLLHVDHVVNDIHRIFHRSAKKKQVLILQQRILGDSFFDVKRYHRIRWVASKKRALESLLLHWKTIFSALDDIGKDKTFEKSQRDDAKRAAQELKDPVLISTLAFATDIFECLSPISLDLQYRGTTLIGKRYTREKALSRLEEMKEANGKHLTDVLSSSIVIGEEDSTHPTLEEFETKDIKFQGIQLIKSNTSQLAFAAEASTSEDTTQEVLVTSLHEKRWDYIHKLITQIRNRFPIDPTDDFDVFDAYLWPEKIDDLERYGNTRMKNMNKQMHWNFDADTLLPEWLRLKVSISHHSEFKVQRTYLPENFWTYYLSPESRIDWPESLKIIITNIVASPASSAEVERIFSFYTSTKTVKRYQLDVSTVDAIIRIKFNGPKNINEFKSIDYLPNFLKTHARSDDEVIPAIRKRKLVHENLDLVESDEDMDFPPNNPSVNELSL